MMMIKSFVYLFVVVFFMLYRSFLLAALPKWRPSQTEYGKIPVLKDDADKFLSCTCCGVVLKRWHLKFYSSNLHSSCFTKMASVSDWERQTISV
jgi:hypothetical protein